LLALKHNRLLHCVPQASTMKWFPLKRRLLPPRSSNSQPADLPVKFGDKYDEASGQVYRETYVSIPSGNDQDWARKRHVVREQHEKDHLGYEPAYGTEHPKTKASKGGRSLQDIVMDTVLDNIANITLEYLESLPSVLVDRIWSEVNQRSVSTNASFAQGSELCRYSFELTCLLLVLECLLTCGKLSRNCFKIETKPHSEP
jgi:hypothetical protein